MIERALAAEMNGTAEIGSRSRGIVFTARLPVLGYQHRLDPDLEWAENMFAERLADPETRSAISKEQQPGYPTPLLRNSLSISRRCSPSGRDLRTSGPCSALIRFRV